jgi:ABC-type nitrate/sulfonate/bicarbonate transport system substrate-binding protein
LKKTRIKGAKKLLIILLGFSLVFLTAKVAGWINNKGTHIEITITDSILSEINQKNSGPLRVAIYRGVEFAGGIIWNRGFHAGEDSDYYKKYGLLVEFRIIEDIKECIRSIKNNEVDIIWFSPEALAYHYNVLSEINPVAFLQHSWSRGEDVLIAKRSIPLSKLKGKRLACTKGSSSHFLSQYTIKNAHLKISEIEWELTSADIDAALLFEKGRADACAIKYSSLEYLSKKNINYKILLSTQDATDLLSGILITRESLINLNSATLEKFALGWFDGVQFLKQNPEEAIAVLSKYLKLDPDLTKKMLSRIKITDYNDNCNFFEIRGDSLTGFNDIFETCLTIQYPKRERFPIISANLVKNTNVLVNINSQITEKKIVGKESTINNSTGKAVYTLTGVHSVFFDQDSSVLNFKSINRLRYIARLASSYGSSIIFLSGSADSASEKVIPYLIKMRVQNVINFLHSECGFSINRFKIKNDNQSTIQIRGVDNRRVDIQLISMDTNNNL